ncbi:MAG: glutamate-5-semialdehyde dehydrogenase [Spirochaetae bacterium HGW-Spirochaetae-3]|jgi:glutamate-5-semialdehyde dehydrogenase|nr:MAG: glutamate-5-semialdehyde dehydrogenase [Spirochaetae bacterium HGW-Spirochaetae-3]
MVTHEKAKAGAAAAKAMLSVSRPTKDAALKLAAERLTDSSAAVFDANRADVEAARAAGAPDPVLARLGYGPKKLEESVAMLAAVAALPDPSGIVLEARRLDSGLTLRRVSCPIGLIALIFESRPDALVQMAALAAKSGDAIIVKGGREAERTNRVLAAIVARAGVDAGLPDGWLGQLETRDEVAELLKLDSLVDLVIPRGSNEFVRHIMETSRIPVLGHANGVCHVYVHGDADLGMAARVAVDSKAQYPAACNAAETLLVDASIAGRALPRLASALEAAGVTLDLCPRSDAILGPGAGRRAKCDDDWSVEYLEPRMAVRVVDSLGEAVSHINRYGSGHTDAIVCSSAEAARRFMDEVDSASVFHNASTRFADGYRYGLGAEVGISTGKLHARGPMGMDGLLTYKWKLEGAGQIVADYASGAKKFEHADIDAEKGTRYGER